MRTLGLIGGISWVSTADYYKLINQGVNERLGGLNYAQLLIHSFNYADIKRNNDANDWEATFRLVRDACMNLKESGAEGIVLCANTMHYIADRLQEAVDLPLLHIAIETANRVREQQITKVGLLGTSFTMELNFFKDKLLDMGIEPLIPEPDDRAFIHATIFDELGKGIVQPETKERYVRICQALISNGATGIILGCTELPLILQPENMPVPVFDTTLIHSEAAVNFLLS